MFVAATFTFLSHDVWSCGLFSATEDMVVFWIFLNQG